MKVVEIISGVRLDGKTAFIGSKRWNPDGTPINIPSNALCVALTKEGPPYLFFNPPTEEEIRKTAKNKHVRMATLRRRLNRARKFAQKVIQEDKEKAR